MAFFTKNEGLKHVPWFSLTEWHQVYTQIYSNDTVEQTKGYETLQVWKARMPKLPVGVECTLALIQVCLKDRDWIAKINNGELPMSYENDLSLMYTTTIMRFLNQISNVGHTKQTSLFQIAKQLNIPEWIVNLRHDAAHGHELPSIELLRMAANMLLTWLHDEYWTAEGHSIEEQCTKESEIIETEINELTRTLVDLIELWLAVGLYIEAGCNTVADLPDEHLRDTLKDLRAYTSQSRRDSNPDVNSDDNYRLKTARSYLLVEISAFLTKNKTFADKKQIVLNVLFESEAFLPTSDFHELFLRSKSDDDNHSTEERLPTAMIKFWQPLIALLHDKKILEALTLKLLEFVNSTNENHHRRLCAALWINSIAEGLIKLQIAQVNAQTLEHSHDDQDRRMTSKLIGQKLQEEVHSAKPELQHSLWLNINTDIPRMFVDSNFISDIILKANEFTMKFIEPLLNLATPTIGVEKKNHLIELIRIYTAKNFNNLPSTQSDIVYTDEDIMKMCENHSRENVCEEEIRELADKKVRNSSWELASVHYDWKNSNFGILPWQIDTLEVLQSDEISPELICPVIELNIVPGILDNTSLQSSSQVNWEKVLRKKQRVKKKRQKGDADIMMDRALKMVKGNVNVNV